MLRGCGDFGQAHSRDRSGMRESLCVGSESSAYAVIKEQFGFFVNVRISGVACDFYGLVLTERSQEISVALGLGKALQDFFDGVRRVLRVVVGEHVDHPPQ